MSGVAVSYQTPNRNSPFFASAETTTGLQRRWLRIGSAVWALIPLLSAGTLALIPALHAALKLRNPRQWLSVVAYIALTAFMLGFMPSVDDPNPGIIGNLAFSAGVILLAGGTVHAFALRPHVFGGSQRNVSSAEDLGAEQTLSRKIFSVLWALIPLLSFGILASVPVVHAALKLRQPRLWSFVGGYILLTVFVLGFLPSAENPNPGIIGSVAGGALGLLIIGGTIHAFVLRQAVFAELTEQDVQVQNHLGSTTALKPRRTEPPPHESGFASPRVQPQVQQAATPRSGHYTGEPRRLSRYELLVLVVTAVGSLLSAVTTILAAALF